MKRKHTRRELTRKQNTHRKQYDNKFLDNSASQAMMSLYARVPHSRVMYNETNLRPFILA